MQDLSKMTADNVAAAAQFLHNNVHSGKWLFYQSDETITPTLLAEIIRLKIGNCSRMVFHADGTMTGMSMEVLTDTDLTPMMVVVAIDPKISSSDVVHHLWKLWHNAAFMRHTTIFVSAANIVDPVLLDRMVKFGYLAEDAG